MEFPSFTITTEVMKIVVAPKQPVLRYHPFGFNGHERDQDVGGHSTVIVRSEQITNVVEQCSYNKPGWLPVSQCPGSALMTVLFTGNLVTKLGAAQRCQCCHQ